MLQFLFISTLVGIVPMCWCVQRGKKLVDGVVDRCFPAWVRALYYRYVRWEFGLLALLVVCTIVLCVLSCRPIWRIWPLSLLDDARRGLKGGQMPSPSFAQSQTLYQRPPWRNFPSDGVEVVESNPCVSGMVREIARRARVVMEKDGIPLPPPPMHSEWERGHVTRWNDEEVSVEMERRRRLEEVEKIEALEYEVARGEEIGGKESFGLVVVGLMYNSVNTIVTLRAILDSLGRRFERVKLVLFENDSTDGTTEALALWAQEDDRVVVLSKILGAKAAIRDRSSRTEKLARYRNEYLDEVSRPEYAAYEAMLVLDTDFSNTRINPNAVVAAARDVLRGDVEFVCALGQYSTRLFWDTFAYEDTLLSKQPADFGAKASAWRFQKQRGWRNYVSQPLLTRRYMGAGQWVLWQLQKTAQRLRRSLDVANPTVELVEDYSRKRLRPRFEGEYGGSLDPVPPDAILAPQDKVVQLVRDAWKKEAEAAITPRHWSAKFKKDQDEVFREKDPQNVKALIAARNEADQASAAVLKALTLEQVCSQAQTHLQNLRSQKVHSCFGAAAVYARERAVRCRYQPEGEECEHVSFHKCIKSENGGIVDPLLEMTY